MKFNKIPLLFLLFAFFILTTCKKFEKEMMVSTGVISDTSYTSAKAGGQIIDLGEGATKHGHCYSKILNMLLTNKGLKTELGIPDTGRFTSKLEDLEVETVYFVKAYLSNGTDTIYGELTSFKTDPENTIRDIDGN